MREPTITRAPPVAHDGIDAKMGEKKTEIKNAMPVVIAVRPVFPPSLIPVALSMYTVTGLIPMRDPITIEVPSVQYAHRDLGKFLFLSI